MCMLLLVKSLFTNCLKKHTRLTFSFHIVIYFNLFLLFAHAERFELSMGITPRQINSLLPSTTRPHVQDQFHRLLRTVVVPGFCMTVCNHSFTDGTVAWKPPAREKCWGVMGVEPTCNLLRILYFIRVSRYTPI